MQSSESAVLSPGLLISLRNSGFNASSSPFVQVRVCDSCFDDHGPRDLRQPAGDGGGGPDNSPVKRKMDRGANDELLPSEYLASSLSQQVREVIQLTYATESCSPVDFETPSQVIFYYCMVRARL